MLKSNLKTLIKKLIHNNSILFQIYYSFIWHPKNDLEQFLNNYSKSMKNCLFFICIGANDGMTDDPYYKFIRRDKWQGILIEPQRSIFERLRKNYSKFKFNGLKFENVAIFEKNEIRKLYKVSFSNSRRASGISSFIKDDVMKVLEAGYAEKISREDNVNIPVNKEDWITTEDVVCITFNNLLSKYKITKIDLLAIDTEGYDYEIIRTIPFERIKPKVIIYEHTHFNEIVKNECSEFLKSLGYKLKITKSDTIAFLE